jgi:hypothetical protein
MPAPTPDMITLARQRYVEGAAISKILAETGMSHGTFYLWLDGGPNDGDTRLPPLPRRRIIMGKRRAALSGGRLSLIKRLWRTAERQVRDIEDRVRLQLQDASERERDARVLAIVVRTLRDLHALDTAEEKASLENDDSGNIDDFRRELARKIDGIIEARDLGAAGAAESE